MPRRFLLLALLLPIPGALVAEDTTGTSSGDETTGGTERFWDYQEVSPAEITEEEGLLSRGMGSLLSTTHRFGRWLDRALGGESLDARPTRTRAKLTVWRYDEVAGGFDDSQIRFNVRMSLPRLEKRLSLFLTNDLDEGLATSSSGAVFPQETVSEDTYLGVNVLPPFRKWISGLRGRAGVRIRGGELGLFVEPRHVWRADFPVWSVTTQARLRYSTLQGWDTSLVANFDRALSTPNQYLRWNGEARWSEESAEETGREFFLRVMMLDRLARREALIYEWNNHLVSEPGNRLESSALVLRYRRQIWKRWLFLELAPQVVFREELEYDPTVALLLKMEMLMQRSD